MTDTITKQGPCTREKAILWVARLLFLHGRPISARWHHATPDERAQCIARARGHFEGEPIDGMGDPATMERIVEDLDLGEAERGPATGAES